MVNQYLQELARIQAGVPYQKLLIFLTLLHKWFAYQSFLSPWILKEESSGAREFHPRALREPDVNLSIHPAPIVQPLTVGVPNGQKAPVVYTLSSATNEAPVGYDPSIFCISG
jgi:hypothetical protein